jgi:hypothetical protein
MRFFATVAIVVTPLLIAAQQQQSGSRSGWPCGSRLDLSYFRIAEGTGGQLLLLAPEEIGDSATLLIAAQKHPQTIFRLAGSLKFGVHDFQVPIDPSVESAMFSISAQCLEVAHVLDPSGLSVTGDGVTDLSNFRALRMVIVEKPRTGLWTVRVSGSGVSGVTVQARSAIAIERVQFTSADGSRSGAVPVAGVENIATVQVSGRFAQIRGSLVNAAFRKMADLPLERGEREGSYVARFTPGPESFRVMITGTDAAGVTFQRVHTPLLTAVR